MKRMIPVFLLGATLVGCVKADDVRVLDNRVYEQKQEIKALEEKVDNLAEVDASKADLWSQMQSLRKDLASTQQDLDTARRELAAQRLANEEAAKVNTTLSEDLKDLRIGWQRLNSQLGTDVDLTAIRAERMPSPVAIGGNATIPDAATDAAMAAGNATIADAPAPAPVVKPVMSAVDADAASTLYKSARASFEARNYRQGIALWDEFVTNFPDHKLAPNALFWQGECYFQMKDYARSALKYQVVIDKYKKSTKYPTSLLKQGIAFMRLGRVKAGRLLLQDVAKKFPKTAEGKRATAILKNMK